MWKNIPFHNFTVGIFPFSFRVKAIILTIDYTITLIFYSSGPHSHPHPALAVSKAH
jgi:hypothetical protein